MKHTVIKMLAVIVATLALVSLSESQVDSTNLPLTFPARVSSTAGNVCPPNEVRVSERSKVGEDIQDLLRTVVVPSCLLTTTRSSPVASCSALPTSCPSGYYWVSKSEARVYCDMDRICGCNGTGGWTRVAFLNMTDTSQQCPGAWILENYATEPRRLCGNPSNVSRGCLSAMYSTYNISYDHVCGRVIGYEHIGPYAFGTGTSSIDSYYLSGVSLTHGPPGARQHIWSFAAGFGERSIGLYGCPCANRSAALARVPSFVGNDFFCESANPGSSSSSGILFTDDPLWDGRGCASPPCCELSYPPGVTAPWFCKKLPQATTDDIEARICHDTQHNHDVPVEIVELYIR